MDAPPIPTEAQINAAQRKPSGKRRSPIIAWIVLLVIITSATFAAFTFSRDIVRAYPPANKIFSMVGFPVDLVGFGLTIHDPEWMKVAGSKSLRIYGDIENTIDEKVKLPLLRGVINDSAGVEIQTWFFEAPQSEILPGERVEFETIVEPKTGGAGLVITFATAEEAAKMDGGMMSDEMMHDEGTHDGDSHSGDSHSGDSHSGDSHSDASHN